MPSAALEHGNSGLKVTVLRAGGQHSLGVVQHTSGTHAGSYVVAPPGEAFVVRVERDPEDDYTDTIRVTIIMHAPCLLRPLIPAGTAAAVTA
jgi:hypothetical protein